MNEDFRRAWTRILMHEDAQRIRVSTGNTIRYDTAYIERRAKGHRDYPCLRPLAEAVKAANEWPFNRLPGETYQQWLERHGME